jgi:osmotically-inducible protein OsmY
MRGQQRYEDETRYEDRDRDRRELQRQRGSEMTESQERQGEWYGYIQPYRYYGPGYRGVGYYSVMYQGRDPSLSDEGEMTGDQPRLRRSGAWGERARQWGQFGGQMTGSFAGRGPKGYQRSDERIREDVSDKLMEHPDLDASEIEVRVAKGEVTLTGSVDSRWAKRLAEDIAESCAGVRDVMNQLHVPSDYESTTHQSTRESSAEPTTQTRNGRRPVASKR